MKTGSPRRRRAGGFTLVEMLTTMAIVAMLISLLVPAFGLIRNTAANVRQRAQFSAIGAALEAFRADFGDYPRSLPSGPDPNPLSLPRDYWGAQMLAEAMIGMDGFGVHRRTEWRGDGRADLDGQGLQQIYQANIEANRKARRGPYLELESANAVKLSDIYGNSLPTYQGTVMADTYVLADQFGKVTNVRTRKKTGMPILYFKANVSGYLHQAPLPSVDKSLIYNVQDNWPFYYNTPAPFTPNATHPLGQDEQEYFYDPTTNVNLTGGPYPRPYRSESYILLSAGRDGLYGTADDVFNFESER